MDRPRPSPPPSAHRAQKTLAPSFAPWSNIGARNLIRTGSQAAAFQRRQRTGKKLVSVTVACWRAGGLYKLDHNLVCLCVCVCAW